MTGLRQHGIIIAIYIDDLFVTADTFDECAQSVAKTIRIFHTLGFIIHPDKSRFIPSQGISLLGLIINSVAMTVTLTPDKKESILSKSTDILNNKKKMCIRDLASTVVSAYPGVRYGPLHYRSLESDKDKVLKNYKGHFNSKLELSRQGLTDVSWWKKNNRDPYSPYIGYIG